MGSGWKRRLNFPDFQTRDRMMWSRDGSSVNQCQLLFMFKHFDYKILHFIYCGNLGAISLTDGDFWHQGQDTQIAKTI
jgi:hypothetical protein